MTDNPSVHTAFISIRVRLTADEAKRLRRRCADNGRSLSGEVRQIVKQRLEQEGRSGNGTENRREFHNADRGVGRS